jgi:bifunctional DNase/RNase
MVRQTKLDTLDEEDDNVDVKVCFDDGRTYTATVFTLKNIQSIFEKNKQTGECLSGLYFWTFDMLIVQKLRIEVIECVIADLIESGYYTTALRPLD